MTQPLGSEEITGAVSASLQQDVGDIRIRVRDLTLRALQTRRLEAEEIRAVVRAVAEGISLGAEHRVGEVKEALATALSGLDDAMAKAAQATHLALQELLAKGRDFGEQDMGRALDDLRIIEQALLDTLGQVADAASSKIKQELKDAVEHARRSGTATGASVRATLSEMGSRFSTTIQTSKTAGKETAHILGGRLAALASGILAGMSEALREKSEPGQK